MSEISTDELPETYPMERMHYVVTMDREIDEVFPAVDDVVVGGFNRFDSLERDFLEPLAETWPTVGLILKQADTDDSVGMETGASHVFETHRDLGFSVEHY